MDEPDGTGRVGGPDAVEGTVGVDDARGVDVEDGCLGADEGGVSDMGHSTCSESDVIHELSINHRKKWRDVEYKRQ